MLTQLILDHPGATLYTLHFCFFWLAVLWVDGRAGVPFRDTARHGAPVMVAQHTLLLPANVVVARLYAAAHPAARDAGWDQPWLLWRLAGALLLLDTVTFLLHRWAHRHLLLRMVHGRHHVPLESACQALNAHPAELLLFSYGAHVLPFMLVGLRLPMLALVSVLGALQAVTSHAPPSSAWHGWASMHYVHHLSPAQRSERGIKSHYYGTVGMIDWCLNRLQ